jgi:hypothetical protein
LLAGCFGETSRTVLGEMMIKLDRNPQSVLDAICKVWKKYPDLRVGQIISNAVVGDPRYTAQDVFFMENLDLAALILDFHEIRIEDD